ncbi:unnamed protein product, partial [Effrenium voratum]
MTLPLSLKSLGLICLILSLGLICLILSLGLICLILSLGRRLMSSSRRQNSQCL